MRLGSEVLLLLIFGVCSTCPKNLIRRAENLLGALFRDGVSVKADSFVEPRLEVTRRVVLLLPGPALDTFAGASAPRIDGRV